ncbi:MAG: polymer-forming cytoskeletal protein [Uliginosibacterium sp.]|jgi:cytoskeletal protein CcmA (bactofilin family)|nr:polymer-forming cytoskeletal protein [Uliginosibacterium sp.]MBK9614884.1 polymer-forming cytoskeletal protein [Uliginosibacterium sp.]
MFNSKQKPTSAPEPTPERQPRVTHTPGAYPPLSPRPDPRAPDSRTQAAAPTAAQVAQLLSDAPKKETTETAMPPIPTVPDLASESPSRLVVGPEVKLKGAEILDCDTLIVEGRVEATMDSRVIRITERGSFAGKVGIDIAEIHGHFEGELTARQQLIIHASGRVKGCIRYGSILIEAGGQISGDIQALGELRSAEHSAAGKEVERASNIKALISSVA